MTVGTAKFEFLAPGGLFWHQKNHGRAILAAENLVRRYLGCGKNNAHAYILQISHTDFVVSYIGRNEPKFEMNNPHYMREVSRSYSDKIPPVILNKEPIQNRF